MPINVSAMTDLVLARDGADLAYQVEGNGPFLGYSHGVLLSRAAEDSLGLLDFDALAGRRRLLRYDARGHGRSTGRKLALDYTWPSLADDLLAMAEVGDSKTVDWAGGSMGTGTLLWAAVRRPARFRRLVLTIPPTTGEARAGAAGMYETWAKMIDADGKAKWAEGMARFAKPAIFETVDSFRIDADITEELLPWVLRGAATTDLPPTDALAALDHPTLILAWESDPVHPVASAEYLAATMPNATLQVSGTIDDVRTWTGRIEEFLGQESIDS
jgi:pimeloyl-ACP methyl ester carboxylesterase